MKSPFQNNHALLDDIQAVLAKRGRNLWWLGQSGFLVAQNGRGLLFDPYLSDSLTRKYANTDKPHVRMTELVLNPAALGSLGVIDVITSSHNHTDHLDAETLVPLLQANPQARLVIPAANRAFVLERIGAAFADQLFEVNAGECINAGDVEFQGIAAAHPTVDRDEMGRCRYLGYVMHWGDLTIYHSGDTLLHDGLVPALRQFSIDIALLPINGDRPERRVAGNLDGPQAAKLAHDIGAKWAIPCHFDLFEFNTASPADFVSECNRLKQPFQILRHGQGLRLDGLKT